MVTVMKGEDPEPEALKEHQRDQEQVERELIQAADSEPEAERHRRRADKAQYLRTKLEEQQRADREAADGEAHQG
jgi:hypothetical protein